MSRLSDIRVLVVAGWMLLLLFAFVLWFGVGWLRDRRSKADK